MLVQVMYENNAIDAIEPILIDELMSKRIKKILRSDGWANVDTDPVRGRRPALVRYDGPERRKNPVSISSRSSDSKYHSLFTNTILDTINEPCVVLNAGLKVLQASRNFYNVFMVTPEETLGRLIYDVGRRQWDIPGLRRLLEDVLANSSPVSGYEIEHSFLTIGHKIMRLNASCINGEAGKDKQIFLSVEDDTERKQMESDLMEYEKRFGRLLKDENHGIVFLDKLEGNITNLNPFLTKLLGYAKEDCIGKRLKDIGIGLGNEDFGRTIHNLDKSGILYYDAVEVKASNGQKLDAEIYLLDRAGEIQCNIFAIPDPRETDPSRLSLVSSG